MTTRIGTIAACFISSVLVTNVALAQQDTGRQGPVGQAPPATPTTPPEVRGVPSDIGGVLTPKGRLIIEPELQYSHSSVNRVTFRGIEILSTLLIGVFDIEDADRDTWTASVTTRLGVTNRLELELKVPYVYRDDTLNAVVDVEGSNITRVTRDYSDNGLGDIELAAHYQFNDGRDGWPYFIGNLRYKTTTGEGPFDVKRDADGIEQELATGSGFHAVEPSVTLLFPSDPAVFFANVGYLFNLEDDVDKRVGSVFIGEVDPGDALRLSFGMAYSINEKAAFTLGFKNDFIDETETELFDVNEGGPIKGDSSTLNVGSLLLGWSYQLNRDTALNLALELGVTEDAPDTVLTLRMPFGMNAF
ncbi:Putative MetA-pathway of phenol degradation [Modicisalibacter ilicicola DSM 19980]|uniref:Putative MetA-pathway of phenol degradation n=1 Tax=Modicisalibacter ilicicola DSM 19980 TaxID=1121942 RepID=A0A1M4VUI7_9GAMM|nr:transporter [Halomonas ilicicola]SHE72577.1 Putative MetA-pathway of phenol degradation [Halomonas ilicicola DSM 19980]